MQHFFVDASQVSEETIRIEGTDVNHMKNVLRMRIGEEVTVSDGQGKEYLCQVRDFEEEQVQLRKHRIRSFRHGSICFRGFRSRRRWN